MDRAVGAAVGAASTVDLRGRVAVVTGAGQGIGRAIATRLAAEGARVVVNDLNDDAVRAVAADIGAVACAGDAASEAGVASLIEAAERLGPVALYAANAGIGTNRGIDALEFDWSASWEVNVMAHVRAARILVPRWLETGERGRFVVTASAAGLLTMLGDAPYSVTKHGALAFAEWLAATYGARGISVHAICPQAVRTQMYDDAGPLRAVLDLHPVLDASDVAEALWVAMTEGRFLVLPHPEVADFYSFRAARPDKWLAGMGRLQQQLLDTEGVTE